MEKHYLTDGTPVTLGMRVKDYDCELGTLLDNPANLNNLMLCTHKSGVTCDAWFQVEKDSGAVRAFDCSRLIKAPAGDKFPKTPCVACGTLCPQTDPTSEYHYCDSCLDS